MDQLDRLRTFVAVAEKASFAAAARSLRISPSAATRAITSLEDTLGVALLRRTTRSVRPTEAGVLYLDRCRRALADLDEAARTIVGEETEPHGLLVVTAPVVFGRLHVVPLVVALLRQHPRIDVRLTLTDRVVRIVDEGIDVAIRIADLPDSNLVSVRLGEVLRVLVASPAYLHTRGAPASLSALQDHDLIAFDALALDDAWRFSGGPRASARIKPRFFTNSVEAAIDAALLGLGIARAFDYQVRAHLDAGRLQAVLPAAAPKPTPVNLLYCGNRHASPNVRAFAALARDALKTGLSGPRGA